MTKLLADGTEVSLDTPTKNTSAGRRLLTQDEIDAKAASDAAYEDGRALREWEHDMALTDLYMPRYVEDIIGVLTQEQFDVLPQVTKDNYTAKQNKRAERPA